MSPADLGRTGAWLRRLRALLGRAAAGAWLRPRRSLLPAVAFFGYWALPLFHTPVGRYHAGCNTVARCRNQLSQLAAEGPEGVAAAAGANLLVVAVVYVLAAATTAAVGARVALAERAPRLFAPDDDALVAVGAVLVAVLVAYGAGVVGAAYSVVGAAVLYVLYFPGLVGVAWLKTFGGAAPSFVDVGVLLLVVVGLPAAQVGWLYALAHGAVGAVRSGE